MAGLGAGQNNQSDSVVLKGFYAIQKAFANQIIGYF